MLVNGAKMDIIPIPFYIFLLNLFFITKDTKFPQEVLPVSSYDLDEQNQ